MSFAVTRSLKEISIRMAVGAQPSAVLSMILARGLKLTLPAIAIGWPVAWLVAKLAAAFLYGIQVHDVLTFTLVPLLLLLVALAAAWIPARRAASVDPMKALRME
jgi:ABC-type antimicrobial peptide transport system permease subunit